MRWLITGGAGYIGSHVAALFPDSLVLDDCSTGNDRWLPSHCEFVRGSVLQEGYVRSLVRQCEGVLHLAGYKYAGESVQHPDLAYAVNVEGTRLLLEAVRDYDVPAFVFASSAAVYGTPRSGRVSESAAIKPDSPYGRSKAMGEWLVQDYARAFGFAACSLRFGNVVGSAIPKVVDTSPYGLVPTVERCVAAGAPVPVYGTDYDTPDGTALRDYVHVGDVAEAHRLVALHLATGQELPPALNVSTGRGTSVLEVLDRIAPDCKVQELPRRDGDPARIVLDSAALRRLGWDARAPFA